MTGDSTLAASLLGLVDRFGYFGVAATVLAVAGYLLLRARRRRSACTSAEDGEE
jgi:hypothetical protein